MAEKTSTRYVTTENVNVRVRPTYASPIVRTVEAGAELEIEKKRIHAPARCGVKSKTQKNLYV